MRYAKQVCVTTHDEKATVEKRVAAMLEDIAANGEEAIRRYARDLDGCEPENFAVPSGEIDEAELELSQELRAAIDYAEEQVYTFAQLQRGTLVDLEVELSPGVVAGHRHIPIRSVGCYVPGGRYSLIASAYMSVIPARVAGVSEIVLCAPPRNGRIPPALLYAARKAGAETMYMLGGVQAVAAMTFGCLAGLGPVDMVVGPGNQYVVEAKRQLFGEIGVDLLAGPTEIGVLADRSADPFIVAADLVGQAEHDPLARAVLITTSAELAQATLGQIDEHLRAVATEDIAREAWDQRGEVIVCDGVDELIRVANDYALEHVEVLFEDPDRVVDRLENYGSLFIGEEATVAYGDKVSGPNHILPTSGAARFTGGLWVGKFLKTVTFERMDREASLELARHCEIVASAEGMDAHARTARLRLERYGVVGAGRSAKHGETGHAGAGR